MGYIIFLLDRFPISYRVTRRAAVYFVFLHSLVEIMKMNIDKVWIYKLTAVLSDLQINIPSSNTIRYQRKPAQVIMCLICVNLHQYEILEFFWYWILYIAAVSRKEIEKQLNGDKECNFRSWKKICVSLWYFQDT